MKKWMALPAVLLTALVLTACGLPFGQRATEAPAEEELTAAEQNAPAEPSVVLRLGISEEDAALYDGLDTAIARLRQELPDIAVVREPFAENGELPDLLVLSVERCRTLYAEGALTAFSEAPEAAALCEKLLPAERARALAEDGALMGLPLEASDFWCLYADSACLEAHGLALPGTAEELIAAAKTLFGAGISLFPSDDGTVQTLFALLLRAQDRRGPEALCRGEASPYDGAYHSAADELYRLQRVGAFAASESGETALLIAPGSAAPRIREQWGDAAVLLSIPWAGEGGQALGAGEAGSLLAVSKASTHHTLAVTAACRLCELLSEEAARGGCGGVLVTDCKGADRLADAVAERRASLSGIEALAPASDAALAAALEESVRELVSGTMTPDEFVEVLAIALER